MERYSGLASTASRPRYRIPPVEGIEPECPQVSAMKLFELEMGYGKVTRIHWFYDNDIFQAEYGAP